MNIYKEIASEIKEKLGTNHVSTIIQTDVQYSKVKHLSTIPQFLIIVEEFDKFTINMITEVLENYPNTIKTPFVVEYKDLEGMLDSIPRSFINMKKSYQVLEGNDITEMIQPPSYEHFRAQTELILRNDVLKVRRDLIRVLLNQTSITKHVKELSMIALNSIRNYYQIVEPELQTTEEIIERFNIDFPKGKSSLKDILEYTYRNLKADENKKEEETKETRNEIISIIISTLDDVLQPLLIEIDSLGIKLEKILINESDKLPYEEFIKKYGEEIHTLQEEMYKEFHQNAMKEQESFRNELDLKFREREIKLIDRYDQEIVNLQNKSESDLKALETSFTDDLEQRTEKVVNEKLRIKREELEQEYNDKLRKTKDELEFKYITTDLQDKEEKLRKEYQSYEKKLRENFQAREKDFVRDLDIKERNFKGGLELEYKAKLEDEKESMRKDFEIELEGAIERNLRKQERRLMAEMARREKTLERTLTQESKRKEKELLSEFKKNLQTKENEVKMKLQVEYERAIGKLESKRSGELMNLIEKELAIRYKEIEKIQVDLIKAFQFEKNAGDSQRISPQIEFARNFIHPPKKGEIKNEKDLFSKILSDNRSLTDGLSKKSSKKAS